jgi:hypothetical protein
LEQFETGKLPAMIERAGYPGIAADLDRGKIAAVLPAMKEQALEMWAEGERLTGHPGLPPEPTPTWPRPSSAKPLHVTSEGFALLGRSGL